MRCLVFSFSLVVKKTTSTPFFDHEKKNFPPHPTLFPPSLFPFRPALPVLQKKTTAVSIYRDDVVFRDPRNAFHGIDNYRLIFWSVRFHGNLFFRDLRVDVSRVWQPEPREIRVRWAARGVSRLPWRPVGVFDGVSTFRLDEEGMIYAHEVNNVVLRPPPGARNALSPLFARLNLVPELEGVGGGIVQGVPNGGGGACPGWRGEDVGGAAGARQRAAPLSAAATAALSSLEEYEVEEEQLPLFSLSSSSSVSAASEREGESVLVLGHEASYSYLTSSLSLWRSKGRRAAATAEEEEEEEEEREAAAAAAAAAAPFFVGA